MQNLQQHGRRLLAHRSGTRFFSSTTRSSSGTLPSLQSRIESAPDQKVITVLEQWRLQQGNQLNPSLVRGIVEKLRDSNRFSKALAVSDWMIERKICDRLPEDTAARLEMIEKVFGLEEAAKFFESIPKNQRGESIYMALLNSYTKTGEKNLFRAESTFKKMRKLGLLLRTSPYNSMLSLYRSLRCEYKDVIASRVNNILEEMKENNVELDSVTVNNALRVYTSVHDVARMEKLFADWEGTAELEWLTTVEMAEAYLKPGGCKEKARKMLGQTEELKDPESYEKLLRLYGYTGKKEDVYRVWNKYKATRELKNNGFKASIGSLLKFDDIKGAEEIYSEWELSGLDFDIQIPTMLVSGYRKHGMLEKAEKLMNKTIKDSRLVRLINPLLEEWGKKGNQVKPSEFRNVIKALCDLKQFSKALEAFIWVDEKNMLNLVSEDYATRLYLIENVLGLEEAEKFFKSSIPENMKNYSVYSTLLTSYTRSTKTLEKAEATFEKMRELGFLSKVSPFNSMISLYTELRKPSNIEILLWEMKEKNIEPDTVTLNNLLKVYADKADINTMEKYKRKWDGYDKTTKLQVSTMDAMAKAYEKSGSTLKAIEITGSCEEVHRLWDEYKNNNRGNMTNEGYLSVVRSLLRLDDVQGAEQIYKEWKPPGFEFETRIPGLLISRYCEEEEYDEAKTRKAVKSVRNKRRLLHFEIFKAICVGTAIVSGLVGFVPIVIWLCTEEPLLVLSSLVLILVFIGLAAVLEC